MLNYRAASTVKTMITTVTDYNNVEVVGFEYGDNTGPEGDWRVHVLDVDFGSHPDTPPIAVITNWAEAREFVRSRVYQEVQQEQPVKTNVPTQDNGYNFVKLNPAQIRQATNLLRVLKEQGLLCHPCNTPRYTKVSTAVVSVLQLSDDLWTMLDVEELIWRVSQEGAGPIKDQLIQLLEKAL